MTAKRWTHARRNAGECPSVMNAITANIPGAMKWFSIHSVKVVKSVP